MSVTGTAIAASALILGALGVATIGAPQDGAKAPQLDRRISGKFENANLAEVLKWLTGQGVNFVADSASALGEQKLTLNVINQPVADVMDAIAGAFNSKWERHGDVYTLKRKTTALYAPEAIPEIKMPGDMKEFHIAPGAAPGMEFHVAPGDSKGYIIGPEGTKEFQISPGDMKELQELPQGIREHIEKLLEGMKEGELKGYYFYDKDLQNHLKGFQYDDKALQEKLKDLKIDEKGLQGKMKGYMWDGKNMKEFNPNDKEWQEKMKKFALDQKGMAEKMKAFALDQKGMAEKMKNFKFDEKNMKGFDDKAFAEKMKAFALDQKKMAEKMKDFKFDEKSLKDLKMFDDKALQEKLKGLKGPDDKALQEKLKDLKVKEGIPSLKLGHGDITKLLDSLTKEQLEKQEKQGYLTPADLTPEQRSMIDLPKDGDWTVSYSVNGKHVTIKSK